MFTLVIGGSASGKSEFAERHVLSLPGKRIYIATMQPWDEECLRRIQKHQAARLGRGFETLECYRDLAHADVPAGANVLLECMSNLCANEMYDEDGGGQAAVLAGVEMLLARCRHVTIVTGEVFSGGSKYAGDTLHYLRNLAEINRMLADRADLVCELVCGLPNVLKGGALP